MIAVHLALALAISPAQGPADVPDSDLRSISAVTGDCVSLTVVGQDITADCDSALMLIDHVNGRRTVSFLVRRGPSAVHFTGDVRPATPDGGVALQVDQIILVAPNVDETIIPGAGECSLGGLSAGPAAIRCQFDTETGAPVSAAFETDGSAPRAIRP